MYNRIDENLHHAKLSNKLQFQSEEIFFIYFLFFYLQNTNIYNIISYN
jgi:hypothetical protein